MIGTSRSVWGFDPRSVPGCQLWLDGADATTVTGTTSVTAWRDKSANGYVANSFVNSVPNPSWVPNVRNGNGVIQYSAGNGSSIANFVLAQTMSIFKVYYPINQSTSSPFIEQGPNAGSESGFFFHSQNDNNFYIKAGSVGIANFGTTTVSNTWQMIEGINPDPANGNTMAFYLNGITKASGGTQSDTTTVTKTLYINGRAGTTSVSYNNYLAELIIYNIAVTTSQRQQIEGYLAHKWGLTGYYDSSIPLSIPGCQLWLDAADPAASGVVPSAGTLSTWVDKSGNGRNATTAAGTPTFALTPSRVTFNGSSWYSTTLSSTPTTETIFLVSSTTNNIAGGQGQIGCTTSNFGGRGLFQTSSVMRYTSFGVANRANNVNGFVNGSIFITDVVFEGTNSQVFINGVGGTVDTTTSFSGSGTTLIGSLGGATQPFFGSIYEVIIFNAALTTTQRQTIEGYLSKKWGIGSSSSIPSTHPFSSIRPHLRTFQPIDVPGCQLWLDAADQSSMTLSGSSVTQWNDKSGNGRNVIQTTTTPTDRRPTYSNGVLNFNGANFLSGTNTFSVVDSGTLFAVARHSSTRGRVIDIRNNTMSLGIEFGTTPDLFFHNSFGRWGQSFTDGTNDLQIIVNTRNGSSAPQYARNGGSLISFTSSQSSAANNGSYFAVGYDPTGAQYLNGVLCDIIYYSNALTTSQRQQVEGYLAHKWGLTPSLPVISPLSIPGCQLWLDAADSSSMTLSGSSVTQWRDKSLNVSSTTSVAGSNVLTQNAMNGRPAILLNGSSSFTGSTTGSGTTLTVCIVATQASECVSDGGLVCFGRSGFSDWNDVGSLAITKWASNSGQMVSTRVTNSQTVNTGLSTPFIYILVFDGTFVNSYLNGTIQTPSNISRTGTFAYTKYTIGTRADTGTASWTGFIGESIVYNTALTTSQRQQIEGYLARKWGISISATLPSPHPFKSFPPASLPFSPRNISGLALWLDGADQSSMTLSGSSVTQWRDKSGNGNNSTSSSATYTAGINGLGSMNNPTISGPITNSGSSTVTIFVIASNNRTGNSYDNMIALNVSPITNYYASGSLFLTRHGDLTNPQVFYAFMNGFPNGDLSFSFNTPFNTPFIFNIFQSGTVGSTYGNGTSYGDVNTRGATFNYTHYYIGTCTGGPAWIGNIGEVIIYNSALTTSQRQQVEGYLAQKWGLTGSLPSSHPFKKLPA